MVFEEAKEEHNLNELVCPGSPGGSSNASFVIAENVASAEEVFKNLTKLIKELNATEH
jgi:hypothetical protein